MCNHGNDDRSARRKIVQTTYGDQSPNSPDVSGNGSPTQGECGLCRRMEAEIALLRNQLDEAKARAREERKELLTLIGRLAASGENDNEQTQK